MPLILRVINDIIMCRRARFPGDGLATCSLCPSRLNSSHVLYNNIIYIHTLEIHRVTFVCSVWIILLCIIIIVAMIGGLPIARNFPAAGSDAAIRAHVMRTTPLVHLLCIGTIIVPHKCLPTAFILCTIRLRSQRIHRHRIIILCFY